MSLWLCWDHANPRAAPVSKLTILLAIMMAAAEGMKLHQLDIKTAFLLGDWKSLYGAASRVC